MPSPAKFQPLKADVAILYCYYDSLNGQAKTTRSDTSKCKELQQKSKLRQAHGDNVAINANLQNQWVSRVEMLLVNMMANLLGNRLDMKSDSHMIVITTERLDKKPHFRVKDYQVLSLDDFAQKFPAMHPGVLEDMHRMTAPFQQENHGNEERAHVGYGLILLVCSNDPMLPVHKMKLNCSGPMPEMSEMWPSFTFWPAMCETNTFAHFAAGLRVTFLLEEI
eukprot:gene13329-19168_t